MLRATGYSDQSPSRAPRAATRGACFAAARAACVSTWLGERDGPCAHGNQINACAIVDVLSDKSCGSKNFMSQNLIYYTSLERSN